MSSIRTAVVALTAAVLLVVVGCGGSSKPTTAKTAAAINTRAAETAPPPAPEVVKIAAGKPLTHAQLIAKGDAICERTNTKVSATGVKSPREYGSLFPQLAIYEKAEAAQLSKLVPPASLAHDWPQIVNDLQLVGEDSSLVATYLQAKNEAAARPYFQQLERLHEYLNEIARKDGFHECAHTRLVNPGEGRK